MIARAKRGGDTSLGEVVSDIALSAGVGAVGGAFFKGTEKAGRAILSRVRTPAGELADKVRSTVGDKMTETEKAATNVLDRTAENEAISPFTPGVGTEHHMARMDDAARRLNDPEEIGRASCRERVGQDV